MLKQKKLVVVVMSIVVFAIFSACSNDNALQDRNSESIQLSDALEQYSLWFKISNERNKLSKNATVEEIFHFENGTVKKVSAGWLTVNDLVELSDDEILEASIKHLQDVEIVYEEPEAYNYTLDITLDESEKNTQFINVETEPETMFSVVDEVVHQKVSDTIFSGFVARAKDEDELEKNLFVVTRVNDNSILFTFDNPDTDKSGITVGKADEWEQLREKRNEEARLERDKAVPPEIRYKQACAACHAQDLSGFVGPSLQQVGSRLSEEEIYDIIVNGRGEMPGGTVQEDYIAAALAQWLSEMK